MPVITFASSKGGAGKTTASIVLGTILAKELTVSFVDADPAMRLFRWSQKGEQNKNVRVVTCVSERDLQKVLKEESQHSDVVIVDLEGVQSRLNTFAIAASDLVIVPTGDEQQDTEDAIGTLQQVQLDSEMIGQTIRSKVLFTRTRAAVKSTLEKALNKQMRENVPCFETELHARTAFSCVHNFGVGLTDLPASVGGRDKAIANATDLAHEVIQLLSEEVQDD